MPKSSLISHVRHAVSPEQQDDAEPDHEGRRDDGQDRQQPQQAFGAEIGALVQKCKAEAQQGCCQPRGNAKRQAVQGDLPDIGGKHPCQKCRQ